MPRATAISMPPPGRVIANAVSGSLSIRASPMSTTERCGAVSTWTSGTAGTARGGAGPATGSLAGAPRIAQPTTPAAAIAAAAINARSAPPGARSRWPRIARVGRAGDHAALDLGQPLLVERLDRDPTGEPHGAPGLSIQGCCASRRAGR